MCIRDRSCTAFMKAKPVMDNFICRTMTTLQVVRHFIDSHSSVSLNHGINLFNTNGISRGRGWAFWSSLVQLFLNFSILSYILHCGKTLSTYWFESLLWILAPDTPSDDKNRINAWCCSLVQTERGAAIFILQQSTADWWSGWLNSCLLYTSLEK